ARPWAVMLNAFSVRDASGNVLMHEHPSKPQDTLEQLQSMLERAEGTHRSTPPAWKSSPVQTGSPLDQLLPAGGLPRGSVMEWLGQGGGSGATMLALSVARAAIGGGIQGNHTGYEIRDARYAVKNSDAGRRNNGMVLVVIDRQHRFYAPAAAHLAIDPSRLIIVRPAGQTDEIWALDQVARCTGVAAVLWRGSQLDSHHFRRLQLACEASGVIGLLVRPHTARKAPSWADVRLLVQSPVASPPPNPLLKGEGDQSLESVLGEGIRNERRRLRVEVLRCRGGAAAVQVELEIDDESLQIRQAPTLRMAARRPTKRPTERPTRRRRPA
ncbi:MAG: hypothetical protein WBF93_17905, partial [Pirellulales bacterium]